MQFGKGSPRTAEFFIHPALYPGLYMNELQRAAPRMCLWVSCLYFDFTDCAYKSYDSSYIKVFIDKIQI